MRTKVPLAALAAGMVSLPGLVAVSCAPANNGGSRQNVSTPAPSTTTSVTTPSAAATTAAPQPAATVTEPPIATGPVLQPMEKSGVMLETKARHTVCQVLYDSVACLGHFTDPRGQPANLVSVNSAGAMQYGSGDAGDYIEVRLDYQTYHALDWTIVADENGTTFTNDQTHRGMWVDADSATKF